MPQEFESKAIRQFRERAGQGDFDGIRVTYRVSGGMPAEESQEPIEEEIRISGDSTTTARALTRGGIVQEAAARLEPGEIKQIFEQLAQGIDSLVPRSKARFLPDSMVGSITVEVEGEQMPLFFLADEKDRVRQGKPIAPAAADAINRLARLSRRVLR